MSKIRQYILDNYEPDTIQDIADQGCSGGSASTLVYYTDTCKFHDDHEEEIWDIIEEGADNIGCKTAMQFIASLNGAKNIDCMDRLKNLLTWYAIEHHARLIVDEADETMEG